MTSNNLSFDDIRHLLERYYDGSSTADEEATLTRFFLEHPDVPTDLLTDRNMFVALHEATSLTPPPELERRILDATCGQVAKNRRLTITTIISTAAAFALFIGIAISVVNFSATTLPDSTDDSIQSEAHNLSASTISIVTDSIPSVDTQTTQPLIEKPILASSTGDQAPARKSAHPARTQVAHRDTLTADQASELIDRLLARAFNSASQHVQKADETVKNIETSLNRISK